MFNPQPKPDKKPKSKKGRINSKSKKRYQLDKEYSKIAKEWKEGKCCIICGDVNIDVHHSAGRVGKINDVPLLLYTPYFVPLCRKCHTYVESNPAWAISNGYSRKRLTN